MQQWSMDIIHSDRKLCFQSAFSQPGTHNLAKFIWKFELPSPFQLKASAGHSAPSGRALPKSGNHEAYKLEDYIQIAITHIIFIHAVIEKRNLAANASSPFSFHPLQNVCC